MPGGDRRIAIGAALLAATAAVLAYRAWTARRTPLTATAEQSAAALTPGSVRPVTTTAKEQ